MLQNIGDYAFGGHTAVRVVENAALQHGETKVGYQFNFTIRRRMQREDGDEYLFDFYTVVISADGSPEKQFAACAAATYSKDGPVPPHVERLLCTLDRIGIAAAYERAKAEIQREAEFWDWDEDDWIGKSSLPAGGSFLVKVKRVLNSRTLSEICDSRGPIVASNTSARIEPIRSFLRYSQSVSGPGRSHAA